QRQRVQIRYRTPQGDHFRESERKLDPYGLAWRARQWYVVGWCHLRQALRSFRLDRIAEVTALQGPTAHFEAPAAFDAVAFLAHGVAT
ncbi:MAG: helix-turn-helix transcriptional regulator, partial [Limnohabitans sp.]